MAKAKKYYAVRKGLVPGVYRSWGECAANVMNVPGAEHRSYRTLEEAERYMNGENVLTDKQKKRVENGGRYPSNGSMDKNVVANKSKDAAFKQYQNRSLAILHDYCMKRETCDSCPFNRKGSGKGCTFNGTPKEWVFTPFSVKEMEMALQIKNNFPNATHIMKVTDIYVVVYINDEAIGIWEANFQNMENEIKIKLTDILGG